MHENHTKSGHKVRATGVVGVQVGTCCIWDKDDSHHKAQKTSPAHRPKLGSVANVVEENGWGQGA